MVQKTDSVKENHIILQLSEGVYYFIISNFQ
jgi:hypothetical protein